MLDNADVVFSDALERMIRTTLFGDDKQLGLYRALRSSQDWPSFQRACGVIDGYEQVLNAMWQIKRRMNGDDRPADAERRMN